MWDRVSSHYWFLFCLTQWIAFSHTLRVQNKVTWNKSWHWCKENVCLLGQPSLMHKWSLYWRSQIQKTNKNTALQISIISKPGSIPIILGAHPSPWANPSWVNSIHFYLWIFFSLIKGWFSNTLSEFLLYKIHTLFP